MNSGIGSLWGNIVGVGQRVFEHVNEHFGHLAYTPSLQRVEVERRRESPIEPDGDGELSPAAVSCQVAVVSWKVNHPAIGVVSSIMLQVIEFAVRSVIWSVNRPLSPNSTMRWSPCRTPDSVR